MPLLAAASLIGAAAGAAGGAAGSGIGNLINRWVRCGLAQRAADDPRAEATATLYSRYKQEQCCREVALGCVGGAACGAASNACAAAGWAGATSARHVAANPGGRAAWQAGLCCCCANCVESQRDRDDFLEWLQINDEEARDVGIPPPLYTCGAG
eukprot:TRINITY_DN8167_c10_g1_i1.p3 TRINITY_DN8167_c10_g1~~TRINITY_DN8167_c10_g1_i1.p3  ORF type:complete len:181 (+),score=31.13 TRINITY_DN8167_c10_g1_i1:81-545(+)